MAQKVTKASSNGRDRVGQQRGRPTTFKPEYIAQAGKLCALGHTDREIAEFFDVSLRTFAYWKARNPELLHALKTGKKEADDRVERSLYQRGVGYCYDAVKIFMPAGAKKPVIRAVRRAHAARCHGGNLLAEKSQPSALARRVAGRARDSASTSSAISR